MLVVVIMNVIKNIYKGVMEGFSVDLIDGTLAWGASLFLVMAIFNLEKMV